MTKGKGRLYRHAKNQNNGWNLKTTKRCVKENLKRLKRTTLIKQIRKDSKTIKANHSGDNQIKKTR